jgi:NADPH:quinone reductase-like Zn-dependent oxidoreductase
MAKKPNFLTHEQAASIPLVALTAYACLEWLPPPTGSQRKVIVRGASGGTGMWLVQCKYSKFISWFSTHFHTSNLLVQTLTIRIVAKVAYDCHVTAICSSKNEAFVKDIGADEVIDYTSQDIVSTLESQLSMSGQSDLIVDCVGGTELLGSYVCTHP